MGQSQPPSFAPRRRNRRAGPLLLPAAGRQGDPPAWPLPGRHIAAEREAWAQLWHTPQAIAWEQLGWTRTVARYCRVMVRAERPGSTAALLGQASKLESELGLTPKAMRMLLWQIVDQLPDPAAETAEASGEEGGNVASLDERRRRLLGDAEG